MMPLSRSLSLSLSLYPKFSVPRSVGLRSLGNLRPFSPSLPPQAAPSLPPRPHPPPLLSDRLDHSTSSSPVLQPAASATVRSRSALSARRPTAPDSASSRRPAAAFKFFDRRCDTPAAADCAGSAATAAAGRLGSTAGPRFDCRIRMRTGSKGPRTPRGRRGGPRAPGLLGVESATWARETQTLPPPPRPPTHHHHTKLEPHPIHRPETARRARRLQPAGGHGQPGTRAEFDPLPAAWAEVTLPAIQTVSLKSRA